MSSIKNIDIGPIIRKRIYDTKNIGTVQNAKLDMSLSKQSDFEKTWIGKRRKRIELIKQKKNL